MPAATPGHAHVGDWRMKSGDLVEGSKPYYYNVRTGQTVWELPAEAKRDREKLLAYVT